MPRLAEWKYRALLVSLLALVVLSPLLRAATDTHLLLHLIASLVFAASLLVVYPDRRLRGVAAVLGIPTLAGLWTGYFLPGAARVPAAVAFHLLAAAFFGFTVGVVLRNVHHEKGVSEDSVCGAFSGYLLTGLAFGHLFSVIELLAPGSFRGECLTPGITGEHRHHLLTYFSFLTLTTVGYGDITPDNDAARGLAAAEAIVGQFYIAVLVAELIGKRVSQALTPPEPAKASDDRPR